MLVPRVKNFTEARDGDLTVIFAETIQSAEQSRLFNVRDCQLYVYQCNNMVDMNCFRSCQPFNKMTLSRLYFGYASFSDDTKSAASILSKL